MSLRSPTFAACILGLSQTRVCRCDAEMLAWIGVAQLAGQCKAQAHTGALGLCGPTEPAPLQPCVHPLACPSFLC